jgi:hypothetical protein
VPSAGISPEAVPRKGGKKKGKQNQQLYRRIVARNIGFKSEWHSWYSVAAQYPKKV